MSRIKNQKKIIRKPKSRRILRKILNQKLDDVLDNIHLESTLKKKNYRPRLIKRQLLNFLEKDYLKISILDTCSPNNLIDFCQDYQIKKDLEKANTHLNCEPVINQEAGHIIDKAVMGWFSPDDSEIVITGHLDETKSTLIHEFSHFLFQNKFGKSEWDFIDNVNNEFESYFHELILAIDEGDSDIEDNLLCVENTKKIRKMFEKRFQNVIYELFIIDLEYHINTYCYEIKLQQFLGQSICLYQYLEYCQDEGNFENQNGITNIYENTCNIVSKCYYWYSSPIQPNADSRDKLENYFQYCHKQINLFSNQKLRNEMFKCLELVSILKSKIYNLDFIFLNKFLKK